MVEIEQDDVRGLLSNGLEPFYGVSLERDDLTEILELLAEELLLLLLGANDDDGRSICHG